MTPDPDAVAAVAAAMHQAECLLGARHGHTYSAGHTAVHTRRAKHFLAALRDGGRTVTTLSERT